MEEGEVHREITGGRLGEWRRMVRGMMRHWHAVRRGARRLTKQNSMRCGASAVRQCAWEHLALMWTVRFEKAEERVV